ncbi:MAG: transglutaminase domain-containing protein [Candidatus Omnitrophica bacterium]|nr:transglutaminase domain-containing protein [Candidatus Omnitrophota bacterium]
MKGLFFSFLIVSMAFSIARAEKPKSRLVDFYYETEVKDIPPGSSELKVWIPRAPATPYQDIEFLTVYPNGAALINSDKTYHNKIIYFSFKSPKEPIKIIVHYKIRRYEYSNTRNTTVIKPAKIPSLRKYLVSNRLMVVSPEIKEMADGLVKNRITAIEKARAIYDFVFDNMAYDKNAPGWGMGDTKRACFVKAGNCTDFHSLFVSLARASGVPSKFVIGVYIPQEKDGVIEGYHCWAEFYDDSFGWVPVDVSEASKHRLMKEYYFGSINENRIELSEGRDIVLEPLPRGEALNYFVYPYAELDGKQFKNITVSFKYKDIAY